MEPEPIMPQLNDETIVGEKVEVPCDMDTDDSVIAPSLMLSSSPDHDLSIQNSPRTPKDAMFCPFASGPDTFLLAPFAKKSKVTEQCETDSGKISENRLVQDVYADLMEAIMKNQAEEISVSDNGCRTPTLENLVNDVAETCPDAPARTAENLNTGKVLTKKKLDFNIAGLCRKLEF